MPLHKAPVAPYQLLQAADLALLRRTAFFRELSLEQVKRLAAAACVEEFAAEASVLRAGANCGAVFVVLGGTLRVHLPQTAGRSIVLNLIGREEVVGEICAADGAGHTASVTAVERCRLLRFEREALLSFKEESPELRAAWERLLMKRLRSINARQAVLVTGKVSQRVAGMLADFAVRYAGEPAMSVSQHDVQNGAQNGARCEPIPLSIPLCLRQEDLASLVKASRFRVNEALGELAAQNLIGAQSAQRFTVLDLTKLCQFSF